MFLGPVKPGKTGKQATQHGSRWPKKGKVEVRLGKIEPTNLGKAVMLRVSVQRRNCSPGSDPAVDEDVLVLAAGVAVLGDAEVIAKLGNLGLID